MTLLFFAGSLRKDSLNKKLAREACRLANAKGIDGRFLDLKDFPLPVYDGDIEAATGLPEAGEKLAQEIMPAQGLVLSIPEYNSTIPGMLKNVVDWLSRRTPMPFSGKHLLILSASPGALGGIRALWHSRQVFEAIGMHVFPDMMGVGQAMQAFDAQGHLQDAAQSERLVTLVTNFDAFVQGH